MKKNRLPYGVQDYTPEECYNKVLLEDKLTRVFAGYGFSRVETSSLEYYDLFGNVVEGDKLKKMFKMTDNDGSLLVLRPDTTIQICRMAATKLDLSAVHRLYYVENSFEYLSDTSTARTREFAQTGVELLGATGTAGNLEVLKMAIEALLACGLDDFLIEIGQVGFFEGLMAEGGIDSSDAKILRGLINNKDMLGVELFLQKKNIGDEVISKVLSLPALFGDAAVLEKARKICRNEVSRNAIEELESLMRSLKAMNLDKYVSVDLGMLQGDYYTGMVIRGVSKNLGVSLLDGGRYDGLGEAFGAPMEAVGFAIGIKRLLVALDNRSKLEPLPACDFAYCCDGADAAFELETVSRLREKGFRVAKYFMRDESALIEACRRDGVKRAFVLTGNRKKETEVR